MIRERQFEVIKTQQVNQHLLCAICREVFYNPIRATCGHTFCGTCLVRWIQMKKSCPLCRHRLERNYQFDKDILATKIVGDIEVKCLRCQLWEGTLAQFKQHKKSQCTYISTNNEIHQDAIEIGDDDEEFTFTSLVEENDPQIRQQIIENIGQQILVQIDQSQNPEQQQLPQQNQDLNINHQDPPQETNINNNLISNHLQNANNNEELNIELSQKNADKIDTNKSPNDENQINNTSLQDDLINQNNLIQQVEQQINQINELNNQQQEQPQIPDSNSNEIEVKNQVNNKNHSINNDVIEKQKNIESIRVDNIQNQIQNDIKDDQSNQNKETNQSLIEQFKINDPDVEIINPTIKYINNKDLKNIKATNKFKINILQNNVKIAEPMMEEINDNLFFEFVDHMKKEMVKKLSDIQYYNTLLG
ncbi:unnamed protein product [Paramecium pentaurelia]|uniref:RING-type domain-containing protein n=1 Tax=Paramecium pentaurelia TaxID=43138 RepID=A0A8S1XST9_9CILI|nr:unnamed protein product [Paramecium pentaurelia]